MSDPRDPGFNLGLWEQERQRERRRREEAQRQRDAEWRAELASRRKHKDGSWLAPRYTSIPVPDPAPGEPRSVLVRQD